MANVYVSSPGYAAVTAWASGVAKNVGDYVRPTTPALNAERVFKATSKSGTGTTGAAEPTWVNTIGATTTDNAGANQIVWTEVTGKESEQAAGNWRAPAARIGAFPSGRITSGDTIFVSQDHAETQGTALTLFNGGIIGFPLTYLCVDRTGASLPPTSTDLRNTATISTTGAAPISFPASSFIVYGSQSGGSGGMTFSAGDAANNANVNITGGVAAFVFNNSVIACGGTGTLSRIQCGNIVGAHTDILWNNTSVKFANTAQGIALGAAGRGFAWKNTAVPVDPSGSTPATLFLTSQGAVIARGLDLSAVTGLTAQPGGSQLDFANCRANASLTSPTAASQYGGYTNFDNCDDSASGKNYRVFRTPASGTINDDISVIRTGEASDGVTSYSLKLATNGQAGVASPLFFSIARRVNATGSPLTGTLYLIASAAAALTNAQIWSEIEYLGNASYPLSSFGDNFKADTLAAASAQPTDTSAWDTGATARQNNHAYPVADVFKVASNPGRMFIVTTAGTSAVAEPGAYASAVDGDQITTDRNGGAMTVRCMVRQKLAVTFTPQLQGVVRATLNAAVASTILYADFKLNIA